MVVSKDLLTPVLSHKRFMDLAWVYTLDSGAKILYSYGKPVATIRSGRRFLLIEGWDSNSQTLAHVRDFAFQNNFMFGPRETMRRLYKEISG